MALILSIETSTNVCSVALHDAGELVKNQVHQVDKSHSSLLPGIAGDILAEAKLQYADLKAVAVSEGPGSYTGLRIGITTAKGLCYANEIPLISVGTLDAMIQAVHEKMKGEHFLCPMMDARRMEVYMKVVNDQLEDTWPQEAKILEENMFSEFSKPIYVFGNGMPKFAEIVSQDNLIFIDDVFPDAAHMGKLAYAKFQASNFENVAYFEPNYLKEWRTTTPKKQLL